MLVNVNYTIFVVHVAKFTGKQANIRVLFSVIYTSSKVEGD